MRFKENFVEKYSKLIDFEAYKDSVLHRYARQSIRINTIKCSVNEAVKNLQKDGWILEEVPWCKEGFFIEHESGRRDLGTTDQHKNGMFFSQGAPSMIPAQLLDVDSHSVVLDMCAAPGGKTNHIACLMHNKGKIVANDANGFRERILKINMERCGVKNVVYTKEKAEDYFCREEFDAILIDAPCTGSGLIKGNIARTKKLLKEWNPNMIKKYARMQRKMLEKAYSCLKNGGRMVYATCSIEPEEDEIVIDAFLKDHKDCKNVTPRKINNYEIKSSLKNYLKIWPHYYDTNGLFIAALEKK